MGKSENENIRLFITADLPYEMLGTLQDNLDDLTSAGVPGRAVSPDNLHLTLAFLGQRTPSEIEAAVAAMEAAASEVSSFEVELGDYGTFGSEHRTILWQGLADSTDISVLSERLNTHLGMRWFSWTVSI